MAAANLGPPLGPPAPSPAATALAREIGAALEDARRARGISRAALARQLGISAVTLLELEHGRSNPTLGRLTRYAEAYGVDLDIVMRTRRRKDTPA